MPLATIPSDCAIPARLELIRPGSWSQELRDHVAKWLRREADEIMLHGESYNATSNHLVLCRL